MQRGGLDGSLKQATEWIVGGDMQTFLPYPNFRMTAETLDRKRLGKQRVETLQVLRTLAGITSGWRNHPAVKMWKGHEVQLADYGIAMCDRWIELGYKDSCRSQIIELQERFNDPSMPEWWGDERVHLSHQSNLLRKEPDHYRRYFPLIEDDLPYYWPIGD